MNEFQSNKKTPFHVWIFIEIKGKRVTRNYAVHNTEKIKTINMGIDTFTIIRLLLLRNFVKFVLAFLIVTFIY